MSQQQPQSQDDGRAEREVRKLQTNGELTMPKRWRERQDTVFFEIREREDGTVVVEPV